MGRLRPRLVRERVRDLAELEPSFHSQGGPLWKGLASGILTFISAPLIFNWETEAQAGQEGVLEVAEFPNRVLELPTLSCLQPLAASRTSWVSHSLFPLCKFRLQGPTPGAAVEMGTTGRKLN